jgi:hypothetical protein
MSKYLNEEPFKETVCSHCNKILRQTRTGHGLKVYRIWVHKDTRRTECGTKEEDAIRQEEEWKKNPFPSPEGHKPTCACGDCESMREWSGR